MKRTLLLSLMAACLTLTSFGQQIQPVPQQGLLSMKEVVDIALQNNLRVRRSLYNVQSFNINLGVSKAAFLPNLNAGGAFGLNYGRALNPVTNNFVDRNSKTLNLQLNSNWTIFNGFRIQNTYRQSLRDYSASNKDLEKAKNDVIINVVTLYINVIFNKELLDNTRYQLTSSQQQLDRITKQVGAGSLPKANQLNQEAQVATNEVTVVNQENALNLSLLQLKQAMQLPSSTPLDVVVPEINPEDLILDVGPDEIYQTALETMPEIQSAILKVESAEYGLKASKGNLYPRLSLGAATQSNYSTISDAARYREDPNVQVDRPIGFIYTTPNTPGTEYPVYTRTNGVVEVAPDYGVGDQLKDNLYRTGNLTLQVPLFNGLQNRAAVQRAAVNNELARINRIEVENTLRQTIETSYNDAIAASKTYSSSLRQVSAREEAARMNQQRFDLGAISIVENQISENDLFQARSDLTRAKYNFIFRKKILDFYQGKPIDY
jgi:outer membrane protein